MSKKYHSPIIATPLAPEKKFEKTLATLILYYKDRFVNSNLVILNLSYSPNTITLFNINMNMSIEIHDHNITRETFEKIITMNYKVRLKYPTSDIVQVTYHFSKNLTPDTTIVYTLPGILDTLACIQH